MGQNQKAWNNDKTVKVNQKGYSNRGNGEFGHEIAQNDVGVKKMCFVVMNEGLKNHEGVDEGESQEWEQG